MISAFSKAGYPAGVLFFDDPGFRKGVRNSSQMPYVILLVGMDDLFAAAAANRKGTPVCHLEYPVALAEYIIHIQQHAARTDQKIIICHQKFSDSGKENAEFLHIILESENRIIVIRHNI